MKSGLVKSVVSIRRIRCSLALNSFNVNSRYRSYSYLRVPMSLCFLLPVVRVTPQISCKTLKLFLSFVLGDSALHGGTEQLCKEYRREKTILLSCRQRWERAESEVSGKSHRKRDKSKLVHREEHEYSALPRLSLGCFRWIYGCFDSLAHAT